LLRGRDPTAGREGGGGPAEHRQPARRGREGVREDLRPRFCRRAMMSGFDDRSAMFVDGRWVPSESGRTFAATSPATGEVIARVPEGTRADASRAVEAAHRARAAMRSPGAFDRARMLHKVADVIERRSAELARELTLDQGKPYHAEALGEVSEAADYFRIAAEDAKRLEGEVLPSVSASKLVFTRRVPRGVYAVIT